MWYNRSGKNNDVAVSTRVRLARNLSGFPFGDKLSDERAAELISKVKAVFEGKSGWEIVDFSALDPVMRASLAERHIVSPEFADKTGPSALITNEESGVYIMVNEEDHIRIQALLPGLDLEDALSAALEAEAMIGESLDFAFSDKLGYLTHCPSNLGTGMRASVMLHLPVYTAAGGIRYLDHGLSKIGLTLRGMAGEGSRASGNLYQISNQVTLGISEEETISKLSDVVNEIIAKERELRGKLTPASAEALSDRVMRDMGVMMYANRIGSAEMMDIYSDVRLGAAMGIVEVPLERLDEMLMRSMPNTVAAEHMDRLSKSTGSASDRDKLRAEVMREILKN